MEDYREDIRKEGVQPAVRSSPFGMTERVGWVIADWFNYRTLGEVAKLKAPRGRKDKEQSLREYCFYVLLCTAVVV